MHRIVHRFDHEQPIWVGSLDQLLVWLYWLDGKDGRFKSAQTILNKHVFKGTGKYLTGINKDPPQALVSSGASSHRIDQLSSGERSLVQLFLRIAVHMTQSSIVIIDELELHLHPAWARAALLALKDFVRSTPGMIVIFTSHSKDVLERFDVHFQEVGLRKGGHRFSMNKFDDEHRTQEGP
jgi:ATPase subunit of ABC transporter with duplicated ATPase domains